MANKFAGITEQGCINAVELANEIISQVRTRVGDKPVSDLDTQASLIVAFEIAAMHLQDFGVGNFRMRLAQQLIRNADKQLNYLKIPSTEVKQ